VKPRLYGTLFYANYLTRAVALYRSLERHAREDFELVMLCMDDTASRICKQLDLRHARVVSITLLEEYDSELASVKTNRTIGEFSWTCTPALLNYLLDGVGAEESAVYLDADMMFFSDPQPVFDEWADSDIAIHEHRFAPYRRHLERAHGRFNVGWVGIRNTAEGRKCLARWRAQCIEECTMDAERGLCGDQKYLDEWPTLYDHLTILQHKGVGLGPWNVERYELTSADKAPHVDGVPLIFYHFHALRIVHDNIFGHITIVPCIHYAFSVLQKHLLYAPYAAALRAAEKEVTRVPAGVALPRNHPPLSALAQMILRADILFARSSGRCFPLGSFKAALDLLKFARRYFLRLFATAKPTALSK
jgi:Nucleotide-diphospho-sugar transferase